MRRLHFPVDSLPLTVFRRSALASGLVTVEQILEAEEVLRAEGESVGPWTEIGDELLAAKLVELGRVNRWQAEQLKVGVGASASNRCAHWRQQPDLNRSRHRNLLPQILGRLLRNSLYVCCPFAAAFIIAKRYCPTP